MLCMRASLTVSRLGWGIKLRLRGGREGGKGGREREEQFLW